MKKISDYIDTKWMDMDGCGYLHHSHFVFNLEAAWL